MSWNFVRFHEFQFQTEPESFSFLSWKTKKFYSKKKYFLSHCQKRDPKDDVCCPNFQWRFCLYQPTTSRIKGPIWVPVIILNWNLKSVFYNYTYPNIFFLWKMYKNIMLQKWILWHLTPYLVRFLFINNGCGNQLGLATLTNPKDPCCAVLNFYFLFYRCTLYEIMNIPGL